MLLSTCENEGSAFFFSFFLKKISFSSSITFWLHFTVRGLPVAVEKKAKQKHAEREHKYAPKNPHQTQSLQREALSEMTPFQMRGNKAESAPRPSREKGVSSLCPIPIIEFVVEEHNHM